jgi:multisubunit Na+/H+ antiporter MnhB subunit
MSIDSAYWSLLGADLVLAVHAAFVAFVVFGLVLILIGRAFSWRWVRNRAFRLAHLAAIGIVALQAWLGVVCPLTTLEMSLRRRAGNAAYEGTFVSHWLEALLYYDLPNWVFVACYTAFAVLVAASWFVIPPDPRAGKRALTIER